MCGRVKREPNGRPDGGFLFSPFFPRAEGSRRGARGPAGPGSFSVDELTQKRRVHLGRSYFCRESLLHVTLN